MVSDMGIELELETRKSVYDCIHRIPGIHLREIQRQLDMPMGLLEFHLLYLERNHLISAHREGHYKRYYVARSGVKNKRLLSLLRQAIPRKIVVLLLERDVASHSGLLDQVNVAPSTLSFHLNKLVKAKVLNRQKQGRLRYYSILERKQVLETLMTYRESFLDEVVDRFADVWLNIGLD